jgi:hyperosmotically inducible protein
MTKTRRFAAILVLALAAGTMAACNATRTTESTGEYVDDSVISNKIRAQIIGDSTLKLSQIDVETFKGTVQLSGFVDNEAAKTQAGNVARNVAGVARVHNNLVVK